MQNFTRLFQRLSVHTIIPVLFLLSIALQVAGTLFVSIPDAVHAERERALKNLHNSISRLQGTLNSMIKNQNHSGIKQELQLLPVENEHVVFAAIYDAKMQMRYISLRNSYQHADEAIAFFAGQKAVVERFKTSLQPYVYDGEKEYQVHAIAPIDALGAIPELSTLKNAYLFVEYDFASEVERAKTRIFTDFFYLLGAWTLFFVIIGIMLYKLLLEKIATLTHVAKHIEGGLYGKQVSVEGFKEVGKIARAFNAMSKKIAEDIYAQQTYAALLKQSEKQLVRSQNIAKLGSIAWTLETSSMEWSEEVFNLFGLPKETVPNWDTLLGCVSNVDRERLENSIQKVKDEGKACDMEIEVVTPDHVRKYVHLQCEVQSGPLAETLLFITIQDITDFKTIESELRHEKERVQNYLDIVGVMIMVLDTEKNVLMINQRGCEIIGYDVDDVVGKNWIENFLPKRFRQTVSKVGNSLTQKDATGVSYFENPVLTKSGEERLIAWRNSSLYDDEGNIVGILTSGEDITDKHKAEEKLAQSELFYRSVFSAANDAIFVVQGMQIVDCNEQASNLFERPKELLTQMDLTTMNDMLRTSEGDLRQSLESALHDGFAMSTWQIENPQTHKVKIAEVTISGLGTDLGQLIIIARDITKKIEQDNVLKLHTRQAQMGEMISMIAHQWRQPLTAISAIVGQLYVSKVMHEEQGEEVKKLEQITQQINYLSQTINDFRDFFKPDKRKAMTSLSKLIKKVIDLLDYAMHASQIELIVDTKKDTELLTFENEVLQVLMTLLKNAQDAFVERKTGDRKLYITTDFDDEYATIVIRDTAGGIPEDVIDDIFLPYFSTKDAKHGTGLGLYMSKTVIEEHCKGSLEVENSAEGAFFTIKLPLDKE